MLVKLEYYKKSGKYYTEGWYDTKCSSTLDVKEEVLGMHPLPGLSGGWEGAIMIRPEEGCPMFILNN